MSNLTQFPPFIGGGITPKFQEFTSSGTFTPSAKLLANGGQVMLELRGGGGASTQWNGFSNGRVAGGSSYHTTFATVSGATTVTIGAGGATGAAAGGTTSFGAVSVAGGGRGTICSYGGRPARCGLPGGTTTGKVGNFQGVCGMFAVTPQPGQGGRGRTDGAANSGSSGAHSYAGPACGSAGGSGVVRVWWFE